MTPAFFEIRSHGNLLWMAIGGALTLEEVWRTTDAFWRVRQAEHDRFLMDWRGITALELSAKDFTNAGMTSQQFLSPVGGLLRAAYVAERDDVFGFTRIVEGVWSRHLDVSAHRDLDAALARLDCDRSTLEATELLLAG